MRTKNLTAAGALLLLLLGTVSAFAVTVSVNGEPLPTSPPAVERGGRVLLPMRTVFESLGATVRWQAATQSITATRGDQTIEMVIGQRTASVNGQPVTLDVPPQLINGYTYVPVRFPAEALGADVSWDAPQQLVSISLSPPAAPPPATTPPPTAPPPAPAPPPVEVGGEASGVVSQVTPYQLELRVGNRLQLFPVGPDTEVVRNGEEVTLDQLQPGDRAQVSYGPEGVVTIVQASAPVSIPPPVPYPQPAPPPQVGSIAGTIESIRGRQITLDTYSLPLTLDRTAVLTAPNGDRLRLRDLRVGDEVVVQFTPQTNLAYAVQVQPEAPPEQGLTVTHDATGTLRPGQMITVTARGPAGGRASFDLGTWQRDIPLQEISPGTYRGGFRVPLVIAPRRESVIVHLRTPRGRELQATADAPVRIALIPVAPRLRVTSPVAGQSVGDRVVVEGRAEPRSEVRIVINWTAQPPRGRARRGTLASVTTRADAQGRFRTDPIPVAAPSHTPEEEVRYVLTVAARGQEGEVSQPLRIALLP